MRLIPISMMKCIFLLSSKDLKNLGLGLGIILDMRLLGKIFQCFVDRDNGGRDKDDPCPCPCPCPFPCPCPCPCLCPCPYNYTILISWRLEINLPSVHLRFSFLTWKYIQAYMCQIIKQIILIWSMNVFFSSDVFNLPSFVN